MNRIVKQIFFTILFSFSLHVFSQDSYEVVIDFLFDDAYAFTNGMAKVGMFETESNLLIKYGFINEKGKKVIDYQFDDTRNYNDNGLVAVEKAFYWKNGIKHIYSWDDSRPEDAPISMLWAYMDKDGRMITDYNFYEAYDYSNGLACVSYEPNKDYGYIDENGEIVIDLIYEDAYSFDDKGLALVKKRDKWGFINKKGETIIDFQYNDVYSFQENGLANVKKGDKWGCINKKEDIVIDFLYHKIYDFQENGLALALNKEWRWGYIDMYGNKIIDFIYNSLGFFSSVGLAGAYLGEENKGGYINNQGKVVIDFQFDEVYTFLDNGIAPVKENNKYGFIDTSGKLIIDCQFDDVTGRIDNGFIVKKNNKYGAINLKGELIINFQYDSIVNFYDNITIAKKENKWGYINKTGDVVVDFYFDEAKLFTDNGLAGVKKEDKWGYIKLKNPVNEITDYINTEINRWQVKGKYEKTDAYKIRVNELSRKKKFKELSDAAVQKFAPNYCKWKYINTEYDADNETFKVKVSSLTPFYLKVPLSEAESLDNSIKSVQFQNKVYAMDSDGKFFLQKASITNPKNGKTYNYSSSDQVIFANTKINTNFESLDFNISTTESVGNIKNVTNTITVGVSDVDINIPSNPQTNDKTFVVIIANENYFREVNVEYANNDGKIFKEYCEKTLGIPSNNIHLVQDATFGIMRSEIKWISDVAQAYNGQAKIIFYYAGHGMPNESDKSSYLLPVDGISSDYISAIKLDDLYNELSKHPTKGVTVFLDACFSGSVRDNGMLANARGVRIKPKEDQLKGNTVVFSAATGDETAYPYKEKQHGLFTYFLLKKLQETRGNIDYKTLSSFIIENVKQQSIVVNQKSQTPQVITAPDVQGNWEMIEF